MKQALAKVGNTNVLINLVSRRVRQLTSVGASSRPLLEVPPGTGAADTALLEIIEGKMERFYSEVCLLEQAFIKDPDKKVADVVNDAIARLGENIQIRRFARYHLGEAASKE